MRQKFSGFLDEPLEVPSTNEFFDILHQIMTFLCFGYNPSGINNTLICPSFPRASSSTMSLSGISSPLFVGKSQSLLCLGELSQTLGEVF